MPTKLQCWPAVPSPLTTSQPVRQKLLYVGQIILFVIIVVQFIMLYRSFVLAAACGSIVDAGMLRRQSAYSSSSSSIPQYYQTVPELFPGPTPTGPAAFLAETNPAPFPSTSYIPNTPLETQAPIANNPTNGNIFQQMGQLSHYFPNPGETRSTRETRHSADS